MIAFNSFNGAECQALYNAQVPYYYLSGEVAGQQQYFSGPLPDYNVDVEKGGYNPPDGPDGTWLTPARPEVVQTLATAKTAFAAWQDAKAAENKAKHKGKHNPGGGN